MGALEMFRTIKSSTLSDKSDWTRDTCSASSSQQSPPPTPSPPLSFVPPSEQISDDSMVNVLQLNANGIGNKLTELGVVLMRNKVKVAVIQDAKLSPKSNYIRNYTTVRKYRRGVKSTYRKVNTGVQQGSKLSPSLFCFYIAGMPRPTDKVKLVCYADDLTVCASGVNISDVEGSLSNNIGEITAYLKGNSADFQPKVFSHVVHPRYTPSQDPS